MMNNNNKQFAKLYEFKDQQEFINQNVEMDLGILKKEESIISAS